MLRELNTRTDSLDPFMYFISKQNPLVLGKRWCLRTGSPRDFENSTLFRYFSCVKRVPSANKHSWHGDNSAEKEEQIRLIASRVPIIIKFQMV